MTVDIPVPGPQVLIPGAALCPFIVSPLRTGGQGSLLTYEHRTLRREIKTFFFGLHPSEMQLLSHSNSVIWLPVTLCFIYVLVPSKPAF